MIAPHKRCTGTWGSQNGRIEPLVTLYYTYIFEMGNQGQSARDEGRGTEVFVRRNGKWVDVGWHLDQGAFVRKDGQWVRVGG